ncbi:VCBS repeat-containing protein [bacterium AH-315-A23]|nr:VCBS repeat-containing protein [bacterium AH-315-A23]
MKTIILIAIFFCTVSTQTWSQSITKNDPNYFPKLIQPDIPGAPKLGKPQLIMGDTAPVWGGGNGWAAPAVYDWNNDGKKDLLIGEFGSGVESIGMSIGNFVRVYQNEGTDENPKFSDSYSYARGMKGENAKYNTGTPLSIYTWCCIAFTPRFADLNNDGYQDLITGQYNPGYVTWFRGSEHGFGTNG